MNYFECFDFLTSKEDILKERRIAEEKRETEHEIWKKQRAIEEREWREERAKRKQKRIDHVNEQQRNRENYWNAHRDEERERMAKFGNPYMPGNMLTPANLVNEKTERFKGKCQCTEWIKDWPVQFHRNQVYIDLFCTLCNSKRERIHHKDLNADN